jgi:hypothetical protein
MNFIKFKKYFSGQDHFDRMASVGVKIALAEGLAHSHPLGV